MSELLIKQLKEGNTSPATSRVQPLTSSRFSSHSASRYMTAEQPSYATGTSQVVSGIRTSEEGLSGSRKYETGVSTSYEQTKRGSLGETSGELSGSQGYRSSYKSGFQSPTNYQSKISGTGYTFQTRKI